MKTTVTIVVAAAVVGLVGYFMFVKDMTPAEYFRQATGQTPAASSTAESKKANAYIYLVDVDSRTGKGVGIIGCGDTVVPIRKEVPAAAPMAGAIRALLAIKDNQVQLPDGSLYYNALFQSNLTLESAAITSGEAIVRLRGQLKSGGACDDPRIIAQIRQTVEQFDTVDSSKIYVEGRLIEEYLSQK